ncbi:MAG TPA: hypothetical protein VFN76_03365 [Candidatus Limnocylindria bacterium]|nr:hypothetical protein [Candidatus Limnocylindria bacterium]
MEGYSVTEAASVLGVPTERVWELLARGVLSGAPEGETGMRVYLQPRPAPAPVEPTGPNGNGGTREPERELSPFRELLTEFRNLTERYGQALLALGEARGEVASLRSRVDLLEARMDLRLPMGQPQAAGWSSTPMPPPLERAVMPAAPVDALVEQPPPSEPHEGAEEEERRARARGPRRATESFAEALARAEDPSPPELPAATEAAAGQRQPSDAGADVGLPREAAGAEEIPVADVADELVPLDGAPMVEVDQAESVIAESAMTELVPEPVAVPEPGVEEGHPTFEPAEEAVPLAAIPAPAPEVEAPAEVEPVEGKTAETEAEALAPAETEADAVDAEAGEFEAEREPVQADAERQPAVDTESEPDPGADAMASPAAASDVEPIAWDAERYTTDIEEPDWFAAEIAEVAERAPAADDAGDDPDTSESQVPYVAAAIEEAAQASSSEPEAAPSTSAADEDATTAGGDASDDGTGAAEMEVAPTATQPSATPAPSGPARTFPGAQDLEAAIAALRAAGRSADPLPEPEPEAETEPDDDDDEWPPRSTFARPPTVPGAATRGPASRAYRRLRRIFPG